MEVPQKNWNGKPYRSLDFMLRERFGEKVYKVTLNGECPVQTETEHWGQAAVFSAARAEAEILPRMRLSPLQNRLNPRSGSFLKKGRSEVYRLFSGLYQYLRVGGISGKDFYRGDRTSEDLRSFYRHAAGLSRRGRAEPAGKPEQAETVWVELGLQTIHEETARYIRRGYPLSCFDAAVENLRTRGIEVIVHTILGLPGESESHILATMEYLNRKPVQGIKLQLLHVLKGTDLAYDYLAGKFRVYEREEYLDILIGCLEHLNPDIVIHRITGDGPKELLIAPLWASRKREVLNLLHHRMKEEGRYQGRLYVKEKGAE